MMERCQKGLTRAKLTISTKHIFIYNEHTKIDTQINLVITTLYDQANAHLLKFNLTVSSMFRPLKTHHQEASYNTGTHPPTHKTASTAVHPHIDVSPYIIHVDVHYTSMFILL